MAFGTTSAIFQYVAKNFFGVFVAGVTAPAGSAGLVADAGTKFALYGNTGTPASSYTSAGTAALTSYNGAASAWVTGNEATGGSGYTAGGNALASKVWLTTPDAVSGSCFTAAQPTWTITGGPFTAFGGLLYDSTITASGNFGASQGICFNAFGGSQSVTGGTFTVAWATAGSTANTVFNLSVVVV